MNMTKPDMTSPFKLTPLTMCSRPNHRTTWHQCNLTLCRSCVPALAACRSWAVISVWSCSSGSVGPTWPRCSVSSWHSLGSVPRDERGDQRDAGRALFCFYRRAVRHRWTRATSWKILLFICINTVTRDTTSPIQTESNLLSNQKKALCAHILFLKVKPMFLDLFF